MVSTKVVVTAANCVQNKLETESRKSDRSFFLLGKLKLLVEDKNFVLTGVEQLEMHPDWDPNDERYDADLAVAILTRTIPVSKFIKPICLWAPTISYDDLIGVDGVIAGWGETEIEAVSISGPKWIKVTAVDDSTCRRSNQAFDDLLSDRTFCAGDWHRNSGPCKGDAGEFKIFQSSSSFQM